MPRVHVHVHRSRDADPRTKAEKIAALAARPGTKGEGEAAKAALKRIGGKEQPRANNGQFATSAQAKVHEHLTKKGYKHHGPTYVNYAYTKNHRLHGEAISFPSGHFVTKGSIRHL
jgi:hypothetical protein